MAESWSGPVPIDGRIEGLSGAQGSEVDVDVRIRNAVQPGAETSGAVLEQPVGRLSVLVGAVVARERALLGVALDRAGEGSRMRARDHRQRPNASRDSARP